MRRQSAPWFSFVLAAAMPLLAWCDDARSTWDEASGDFSVGKLGAQSGWLDGGAIDSAQWKAIQQPDLAAQLDAAPELELAEIAPPPERCWVGHRPYLVPNPDGNSWDMAFPYYNKYGGIPVEGHRIFWMTNAAAERYLVLSSKHAEQGKLLVWDTRTHEIVHQIDPPAGASRPGPIVEAIGKTDPAQLAFAQGEVYIAGGSMLRRIEGIAVGDR